MSSQHERRDHARVAFNAPGRWACLEQTCDVRVLDLSFKGALIEVPPSWLGMAGLPCLLGVTLQAGDGPPLRIVMSCEVAHADGHRAGLRCLALGLDSATHLRTLIATNLGDPALLERELAALVGR